MRSKIKFKLTLLLSLIIISAIALAQNKQQKSPMVIQEQGSFAVGGRVVTHPGKYTSPTSPEGQTIHGDHVYVFYQKPLNPRRYPLVFVHGIYQFSKTWETTPDGREGFQNIFLRRGFSTYNLTIPRRGHAGRGTVKATVSVNADEQLWFNRFRVGVWPGYYEGVQFDKSQETLNQYFRQITPNIGPFDFDINTDAIARLFDDLGGAIMICHSHGGAHTWLTVPKCDNIKAIVAWEPGGYYSFPNDEPEPDTNFDDTGEYIMVAPEVFEKFTKMPIVIYYGDYIPDVPSGNPELDEWGVRLKLARLWADAVNKRGGDVTVIHLPDIGIKGNTHFPMSDLNNIQIADLMSEWLEKKGMN